jgi:hypothetical protein
MSEQFTESGFFLADHTRLSWANPTAGSLKVVEVPGLVQGKPAGIGYVVAEFAGGAGVEGTDAACIVVTGAPAAAIPPRPMH